MTRLFPPAHLGPALAAALLLGATAASAQPVSAQPAPARVTGLSWTDWADLAVAGPVVVRAEVRRQRAVGRRAAPDVPASDVRLELEGQVQALLVSPIILPAGVAWRWQGPRDARGRAPGLKGQTMLLFAEPLGGSTDPTVQALRLVAPHAMQPWSAAIEAEVRALLREALDPRLSPGLVTAVTEGFRTEGDIPGISESQFFLATSSGRPMALVVRRAPGRAPEVAAATAELVGTARPIARQTLVWRALACGLPASLPARLGGDRGLAADYALARASIGPCGRTRLPPAAPMAAPRPQPLESVTPTAAASG